MTETYAVVKFRNVFTPLSSGENLGWLQKMMGHSSLKMITDKYFSYIPNMTHHDGSKFMAEYEKKVKKEPQMSPRQVFWWSNYLISLVEAGGVEPPSENIPLRHLHA